MIGFPASCCCLMQDNQMVVILTDAGDPAVSVMKEQALSE